MKRITTQRQFMNFMQASGSGIPWVTISPSAACLELHNGASISFRAINGILEVVGYIPDEVPQCRQVVDGDT